MTVHKYRNAFVTVLLLLIFSCYGGEKQKPNTVSEGKTNATAFPDTLIGKTYQNIRELGAKDSWGGKCVGTTDDCFSIAVFDTNLIVVYEKVISENKDRKPVYKIFSVLRVPKIKGTSIEMTNCRSNAQLDDYIVAIVKNENLPTYNKILYAWKIDKNTDRFKSIAIEGIDCINESFEQ